VYLMKARCVSGNCLFLTYPACSCLLLLHDDCFGQPAFAGAAPDADPALGRSMSSWHADGEGTVDGSNGLVA
jgi:hypothetical protein